MIRVLEGWNRVGPGMSKGQTLNLDSALSQLYETVAAILTNAKMYLNCTSKIEIVKIASFFEKIAKKKCEKFVKVVKNAVSSRVSRASRNFRL